MIDQNKIDEILKKFDLLQNNLNEEKLQVIFEKYISRIVLYLMYTGKYFEAN